MVDAGLNKSSTTAFLAAASDMFVFSPFPLSGG